MRRRGCQMYINCNRTTIYQLCNNKVEGPMLDIIHTFVFNVILLIYSVHAACLSILGEGSLLCDFLRFISVFFWGGEFFLTQIKGLRTESVKPPG